MGALVTRASEAVVLVVRGAANELRLAEQIERLLGEGLLDEMLEVGSVFIISYGTPKWVTYNIYDERKRADRAFIHKVRRALRVPTMERRLVYGEFLWHGTSVELFDDGVPIEVRISASKNGCGIKRIEEQIMRVRFESDCKPEDAILLEEAASVESVPALAVS